MKKGLGKALGKGLGAMLSGDIDVTGEEIIEVGIEEITPNQNQPRKNFKTSQIEELAESIKEFGIIHPLIVTKDGDKFLLVAGERRWRAAQAAGLEKVPVIVREYSELEMLEIALIENVQREDLNPIEEAICYKRLNDEFFLTQEEISQKVGKSRSHITNAIRILKLNTKVQDLVISGELSVGHAKAILPVENQGIQQYFAKKITEEGMSVREAEEFVKKYGTPMSDEEKQKILDEPNNPEKAEKQEKHTGYQLELRSLLGTRVNIRDNRTGTSGGKIEINYFSQEDLNRIVDIIKNSKDRLNRR